VNAGLVAGRRRGSGAPAGCSDARSPAGHRRSRTPPRPPPPGQRPPPAPSTRAHAGARPRPRGPGPYRRTHARVAAPPVPCSIPWDPS
jgi:hypothetical protein